MSRKRKPPTISGPDHGVRLSSGQRIDTSLGAGFLPSETMTIEMSSGTLTVKLRAPAREYSPSQRSEPCGLGTSVWVPFTSLLVSLIFWAL